MALSTYLANALLNHVLGNTSFTSPGTAIWVALYTTNPSAGGGGTEVSGTAYVRVQNTSWSSPSSGLISNASNIIFPTAGGSWGTITSWGIFDASSSGNLLFWGWLSAFDIAFTAATSTSTFTAYAHGLNNGDQVVFEDYPRNTNLPSGLTADTLYFIISSTANTFQISTTNGGSAVTLSSNGEGIVLKVVPQAISLADTVAFATGNLSIDLT